MANTPNMNLALPIVSSTLGPPWATMLNAALAQVDTHNHTTGQGVPVPSAGININADLSFGGYNVTGFRSTRFTDQTNPLTAPTDVGCLYLAGGNLFFNSGAGAAVQITVGAALAGTPGSIGGLSSPAAVTYTSVNSTFRFTSNTNVNAILDVGPILIRQPVASANSITLQSPNSLAANYAVTLPTALPAAQQILTLDSLGMMNFWNIDGVVLVNNAGVLRVVGVLQYATNSSATLKGNRNGADAGADVVSNGAVIRTAGYIHDFQNNGASKAGVDFAGSLVVHSSAAAFKTDVTNASAVVQGNRSSSDTGADVVSDGAAIRVAGVIHQFNNNGVVKANVGFDGRIHAPDLFAINRMSASQSTTLSTYTDLTSMVAVSVIGVPVEIECELFCRIPVGSIATAVLFRFASVASVDWYIVATAISDLSALGGWNMSAMAAGNSAIAQVGVSASATATGWIRFVGTFISPSSLPVRLQFASNSSGGTVTCLMGRMSYRRADNVMN